MFLRLDLKSLLNVNLVNSQILVSFFAAYLTSKRMSFVNHLSLTSSILSVSWFGYFKFKYMNSHWAIAQLDMSNTAPV